MQTKPPPVLGEVVLFIGLTLLLINVFGVPASLAFITALGFYALVFLFLVVYDRDRSS